MEKPRKSSMEGTHLVTGEVGKVKNPKKIIVIGAGIGGMCAAARLARVGHHVSIYEASDQTGGKCRTEWIGRYAFDTGPSLLTIPAVFRDFFQRTGKHMGQVMELDSVDPSFDYRFHDGTSIQFANLSRKKTLENISQVRGADSAQQWDEVLQRAERMWEVSREPFVESELKSPLSLLKRRNFLSDLRVIAPRATLRDFALSDSYLSKILDRYATYSGSDPRRAPAVLSTIAYIEETFGAWHIKGGIGTLSTHIAERCEKVGVQIHLNSPVSEILLKGNKTVGIKLNSGEAIDADIVISNADAGFTYNTLIKKSTRRVRKIRKAQSRLEPSLAGFTLLLGLRPSSHPQLSHHTILFPEDYDAEFDAIFSKKVPVEKPTIYICSPRDESMVKSEGHQALSILINAPRHSKNPGDGFDWSDVDFAQRYAHSIIDQIEAAGIPIRERLDLLEIRTPLDLQNAVNAPGGSIYGTSSNGARAAFLRAKNRSPIKNLYMVGGSAHPGGGLPLVGLSAEIVANAITSR